MTTAERDYRFLVSQLSLAWPHVLDSATVEDLILEGDEFRTVLATWTKSDVDDALAECATFSILTRASLPDVGQAAMGVGTHVMVTLHDVAKKQLVRHVLQHREDVEFARNQNRRESTASMYGVATIVTGGVQ